MFRKPDIKVRNRLLKSVLISIGTLSVFLGFLGIFIPLLPTTPFLLLAAACYIRSSDRFYQWLIDNKWLGRYIRDYHEKRGMKLRSKIFSLSILWITIACSVIFATDNNILRVFLVLIALGVTIHLSRLKTLK